MHIAGWMRDNATISAAVGGSNERNTMTPLAHLLYTVTPKAAEEAENKAALKRLIDTPMDELGELSVEEKHKLLGAAGIGLGYTYSASEVLYAAAYYVTVFNDSLTLSEVLGICKSSQAFFHQINFNMVPDNAPQAERGIAKWAYLFSTLVYDSGGNFNTTALDAWYKYCTDLARR